MSVGGRDTSGIGRSRVTQSGGSSGGGSGGGSSGSSDVVSTTVKRLSDGSKVITETYRNGNTITRTEGGGGVYGDGSGELGVAKESPVSPAVKTLFTGRTSPVVVSGPVAAKLAREGSNPQSIRSDVVYGVSVPRGDRKTYNLNSVDSQVRKENDTRTKNDRSSNRLDNLNSGELSSRSNVQKDGSERKGSYAEELFYGATEVLGSPIKGAQKLVRASPVLFGAKFKTEQVPLYQDRDVQSFGIAVGAAGLGAASPVFSKAISIGTVGFSGYEGINAFKENQPRQLGSNLVLGALSVGGLFESVKGSYIKFGSEPLSESSLFDADVLSGKEKFPLTGGIKESVSRFESVKTPEGKLLVQNSADAKKVGLTAGIGGRAKANLEDPGIFVTPAGSGSPAFLGISDQQGYSFNPIPKFGIPTVTRFEAEGITRLPREVINKPGFKAVGEYQESNLVGTGFVQITKRSELGQGELVDLSIPGKAKRGTVEIEAVVPKGQAFEYTPKTKIGKIKGFDYYTEYNGEPVAVRDAKLIVGKPLEGKSLSFEKVKSEQNYLSGYNPGEKRVSFGLSRGSSLSSGSRAAYSNTIDGSKISDSSSFDSSSIISSGSPSSFASGLPSSYPVGSSSKSFRSSRISSKSSSKSGGSSGGSSPVSRISGSSSVVGLSSGGSSSLFGNRKVSSSQKPFSRPGNDDGSIFSVEVKRRGVFESVGKNLTLSKALKLGSGTVRGSSSRSVRFFRANKSFDAPAIGGFYKKNGVQIEDSRFAINSPGELSQITFKGVRSNKRRTDVGVFSL